MLTRRQLRVRVLQNLYAAFQSEKRSDTDYWKKQLEKDIQHISNTLYHVFYIFIECCQHELIDVENRNRKHLPSEDDKTAVPRLVRNSFLERISQNEAFKIAVHKNKWDKRASSDMFRDVYRSMKDSEALQEYLALENPKFGDEKECILRLFNSVFLASEKIQDYFEEYDLNWDVDDEIVHHLINQSLNKLGKKTEATESLLYLSETWEDDLAFMYRLQFTVQSHDEEFQLILEEYTQNWDAERIALLDQMILKMAFAEFMHFETIPIKVSINEYVELAKSFSTPKSKIFVNGLLDKISKDFKKSGKIIKTGRGLIGE